MHVINGFVHVGYPGHEHAPQVLEPLLVLPKLVLAILQLQTGLGVFLVLDQGFHKLELYVYQLLEIGVTIGEKATVQTSLSQSDCFLEGSIQF